MTKLNQPIYCWKIDGDNAQEEEDPMKLQINEIEGERVVQEEASSSAASKYTRPLKTKKHNIGIEKDLNWLLLDIIGMTRQLPKWWIYLNNMRIYFLRVSQK